MRVVGVGEVEGEEVGMGRWAAAAVGVGEMKELRERRVKREKTGTVGIFPARWGLVVIGGLGAGLCDGCLVQLGVGCGCGWSWLLNYVGRAWSISARRREWSDAVTKLVDKFPGKGVYFRR